MFSDRDIICFLGDSLTASGLWTGEVYQRLAKKYDLKLYSAGISGGRAGLAVEYLHRTCLIYNPTHVVITFGANDIKSDFYSKSYTLPDKEEKKALAIEEYKRSYEQIVLDVIAFGAKPIICTPPPYDEESESETENRYCQAGLDKCADFAIEIAKKYSLPLVDFRSEFKSLMKTRRLISPDRVHPTPEGYHAMAELFLLATGESDKTDFDKKFIPEDWNKKRMAIERKVEYLNFIDFVWLYKKSKDFGWGTAEKIEECKKGYDEFEYKFSFIPSTYRHYIENIHKRDEMINELIRLTPKPKN